MRQKILATLAATVMQIIGPLLSFGLPFAAQKVFAEKDGDRQARGVLAIAFVLGAVAWGVVTIRKRACGSSWARVIDTSPVPGGRSTSR